MILRNFIVFEGIDGTGTSTQLQKIKSLYEKKYTKNMIVDFTCEPTSGEIGQIIRKALQGEIHFSPDTMAHLFASDRCEHLFGNKGIISLLDSGHAVFSDRYFFSSLAYQGEAGDSELPYLLNKDFPLPEYLFYFDLDPSISMKRVENRSTKLEIYEKIDFQVKVRARYAKVITDFKKSETEMKVININAVEPIEDITEKIWSIVGKLPKLTV